MTTRNSLDHKNEQQLIFAGYTPNIVGATTAADCEDVWKMMGSIHVIGE